MMWFVAVAAVMVVVAVALVVPVLLRRRVRGNEVAGRDLRRVYRDRLAELEAERELGNLSETGYREARDELEREVLEDADRAGEDAELDSAGGARPSGIALAVVIPIAAVALYAATGRPDLLGMGGEGRLSGDAAQRFAQMQPAQRIGPLEDFVERNPEAPRAWRLLGEAYLAEQQYGDAYSALARARQTAASEDAGVIARQAEALLLANGRRFTRNVRNLIDEALDANARHPLALLLAGHADLSQGRTQDAVDHWQMAIDVMPEGSSSGQAIQQMIAQVQDGGMQGRGMQGDTGPTPDGTAEQAGDARVAVRVRLAEELAGEASPGAPVFIFARAAGPGGGGPPVAVARTNVGALPTEVTLTDAQAMVQGRNLSQAGRVVITARVAKSGDVMPQAGDLQGMSGAMQVSADARTEVVIDQVVDGSSPSRTETEADGSGDTASAEAGTSDGARLAVDVRLADDLAGEARPDAPVFVFASPADGTGGPPLAVARTRVSALPAEIMLTDGQAMVEGRNLSQAERVMVTARVANSGGVQAQPGDLEGSTGPITVGESERTQLNIDRRIQ